MISRDTLRRIQSHRFRRGPCRTVRIAAYFVGNVGYALRGWSGVRTLSSWLAPVAVGVFRTNRWIFDLVPPTNQRYWSKQEARWRTLGLLDPEESLDPFVRGVHGWLGIEGAGMRYPDNWRILELEPGHFLERLYHRDEDGEPCPGCPWGSAWKDGYACRSVMMATRNVCRTLQSVKMNIDNVIPEMIELETLITERVRRHPDTSSEELYEALAPSIVEVFERSEPPEDGFFDNGRLHPQTVAVVREMIETIAAGKQPALFCQFRLAGES